MPDHKITDAAWYESWFNSPYYHLLYKDRDYAEAEAFLNRLTEHLSPRPDARFLDLACGKGRHSVFLAAKGFKVTGLDLSPQNIRAANETAAEQGLDIRFREHDMREDSGLGPFDFILNLFTSFGYFDDPSDNLRVLQAVRAQLAASGTFVLDFMNPAFAIAQMKAEERIVKVGQEFCIRRWHADGYIFKSIELERGGRKFSFQEKVQAISAAEFEQLFEQSGLRMIDRFGSYSLDEFDLAASDRCIMIAKAS